MRYSVVANVLISLVGVMVVGCGYFGSNPPEETRTEHSMFIEDKMDQLRDAHARLVLQIEQRGLESKRHTSLDALLNDLAERREAVQRQVEALKMAKGQDWFAIQYVMNHALEELAQSYDQALAKYPG